VNPSRLTLLTALLLSPGLVNAQQPEYRELAADEQVIHALNRLTFGARPGDVSRVRAIGLDKWVEQQLRPERIADKAADSILRTYRALGRDPNDMLREFTGMQRERRVARRNADSGAVLLREEREVVNARRALLGEIQSARVVRALVSERQLQEVVTDFWLNHFNVFAQKGPPQPFYLPEYEETIRRHSLGSFRDLLGAVARSPAMLFYLDNARSMGDSSNPRLAVVRPGMRRRMPDDMRQNVNRLRNGGLNENYARELLELHTLGVDGGYTQQDVIEVARAFTGWTIRQPGEGGGFVFRPAMHDAASKRVLGTTLRAGQGIEDGEKVLDILASHPSTARHIAEKLAIRFVSDKPSPALIDNAARVFQRTGGDIRETVRAIVTSSEFHSRTAWRSKVKSPFEVVVSALRAVDAEPDPTPRTAQIIALLGQPIYGHQAPDGYPETGESWMNAGAILNRINFGIAAAAGRVPGASIEGIPGIEALRNAPRESQVDAIASMLFGGAISPETRAVLISGENPLASRAGSSSFEIGATGIAQVVGLALGSPEFQRR
jgi:uncharacterized protein (DUF1800 family)